MGQWQFWIDRGGTFTDVVARAPEGRLVVHKLLSSDPHYQDAAIQGIRDIMGLDKDQSIPTDDIAEIKMGTTVGTNALLERQGEPTVLAITRGMSDVLRIGYQNRPDLFAKHIVLPELLYERVISVEERMQADGTEVEPVNEDQLREDLQMSYDIGYRAIAIVLMHSYRYPEHEKQVAKLAKEIGFTQISVSHELTPLIKIVGRGDTTVVDAYLSPMLRRYVEQVKGGLSSDTKLMFMQSNGGLTDANSFRGKDSILSGPAGGIVGAVATAQLEGFEKIISFDMGGTSTDVAHYDGEFERSFETEAAGVRLRAPMMRIHTVAAGGGSICQFDGSRYRVGPDSAGAEPGPACYRKGGPLTVTDCNVMLGRIQPDLFPKVFGPDADQPIAVDVVKHKFEELAQTIGDGRSAYEVAQGFRTIAVENMSNAIKEISVQRGYDVTKYGLCCFGGAGAQHACDVADALGMTTVFLHPFGGVLSAYGMGLAKQRVMKERSLELELNNVGSQETCKLFDELESEAVSEMIAQGYTEDQLEKVRRVQLRYKGTSTALEVPHEPTDAMYRKFTQKHQERFGFTMDGKGLIIGTLSVEVIGSSESAEVESAPSVEGGLPRPISKADLYTSKGVLEAKVWDRASLGPGNEVTGPALIIEKTATIVVEPGWSARVTELGNIIMTRTVPLERIHAIGTKVDPVMLEIFNKRFMSMAEQMGYALQNTSYSVNIKERLDFSCAIFDAEGELVANAPHIPVHLGSMDSSVKSIIRDHGDKLRPGDVYLINSPYNGGTHLPDVTLVTPVFDPQTYELLFFTASRGHHSDIGGMTPGSMPPDSKTIEEEGVMSDGMLVVERGRLLEEEVREWLTAGKYPARNPDQNVADFKAQIAANESGVHQLNNLVNEYSLETVKAYMSHVRDNAEESVRRVIDRLAEGDIALPLDDGSYIKVKITIDKTNRSAIVDFTGTTEQRPNNSNAPMAVVRAAVLYTFRTLVADDIPMNAGCLRPIKIRVPKGCMLNPEYPAAVVAGNVETSQNIVDAIMGALGVMAGSHGTMNNFTFGNEHYQYYETICGGTGAGPDHPGTSAVHSHMTNTRITDPEILEWEYPVLLEEFSIRRESGGKGKFNGGDGVIRRVRFLEPMTAAILSSRRKVAPFGVAGGGEGLSGLNCVIRNNDGIEDLEGRDITQMEVGDAFEIWTPGGGGYGEPEED